MANTNCNNVDGIKDDDVGVVGSGDEVKDHQSVSTKANLVNQEDDSKDGVKILPSSPQELYGKVAKSDKIAIISPDPIALKPNFGHRSIHSADILFGTFVEGNSGISCTRHLV